MKLAKFSAWSALFIAPVARYWFNRHGMFLPAMFVPISVVDSIAVGCLVALYRKSIPVWIEFYGWIGWPVAALLPTMVDIGNSKRFHPLPQLIGHSIWSIFNVCVAMGIIWAIRARPKILNNRMIVWLGTLSYSAYLFQMPFMNPDVYIPLWARLLGVAAISLASFYLVEKPILSWRAHKTEKARV